MESINFYIVILYFTLLLIIFKILKQRDDKIKLEKYKIDIKYGSDFRVENQLDTIINSVFDEYRLYNLEYRDSSYIKETEEKKIIEDICNIILDRISPVFLTQLSTYFNTDSLGTIIAVKVSTKVAEYKIKRNIEGDKPKK